MRSAGFAAALLALGLAGCATPRAPVVALDDDCTRWFAQFDAAVDATGVRDAQDERIEGFPGLRVDRLGVALRQQAANDDAAFVDWLARASALDRDAVAAEAANLPAPDAPQRAQVCRERWPARLRDDAAARRALLERAQVPDRYSTALRAAGLYPLVRWPFYVGVRAWQSGHAQAMARWAEAPPSLLQRYRPPPGDAGAPVFEIETRADHDRFGRPTWSATDPSAPRIDTAQPVVYRREAQTLYRGQRLRQVVYTLWFPERPLQGRFDLLGGRLDGVIVRLTLAPDGRPLVLDTIHACGCYHLFFVADGVAIRPHDAADEEGAFVVGRLPALQPGERFVVRIASATHYVMGVAAGADAGGTPYALRDDNELRSLPRPDGSRRSLYGPNRLVAGTERRERFLFWPMGIASAGAMRQWGHHATAFVGRRHFDDADVIERRFVLPHNGF